MKKNTRGVIYGKFFTNKKEIIFFSINSELFGRHALPSANSESNGKLRMEQCFFVKSSIIPCDSIANRARFRLDL